MAHQFLHGAKRHAASRPASAPPRQARSAHDRPGSPGRCACGGDCPRCLAARAEPAPIGSAGQGAEIRTTTRPFKATIRALAPVGGAGQSKSVHDGPGEDPVPSQNSTSATSATKPATSPATAPQGLDDESLYIAQMGGPDAYKDTQGLADAVGATFAYTATPSQGGVVLGADDFGDTTGSLKHFSNVVITPAAGKFNVTADLKQTIAWDTRATVGPANQVNITSDTDAALTNANYARVVSDLTPDLTDLKGRPPRTKFWSKDFTVKHEKYHVKDFTDVGQTGATGAEAWLATQAAARKEDVPALLDTAWTDKIFKVWDKFTDPPKVEERAYDDGVASYTARANAIKAKGDKGPGGGGYP